MTDTKQNKVESIFSSDDIRQIESMGTTPEKVLGQIETFKRGIPFVVVNRPCTVGDGVLRLQEEEVEQLAISFEEAESAGRVMKFTPASGAASRMFKLLLSFYHNENRIGREEILRRAEEGEEEFQEFRTFLEGIRSFAFYDDLKEVLSGAGIELESLIQVADYKPILEHILTETGLNYATLPKGLIKFHGYQGQSRTSFEEHFLEALAYARDGSSLCRVHFTLSPEHVEIVKKQINEFLPLHEKQGVRFDSSYSTQDMATDTIAVNTENEPFRDSEGKLLFRPGGHGALLTNLNRLDGDIVFIKNIDNVVPDHLRDTTIIYKKALGGYLVKLQKEVFHILRKIAEGTVDETLLESGLEFAKEKLFIQIPPAIAKGAAKEKADFLFERLNRPIRVCGMVKNEGEPGGGPFWVNGRDGTVSLQIVEKSQVDLESPTQREALDSSTHFNPVDLICGVKDYRGEPFDLMNFTDPETGFISSKSSEGRQLKALELPGLWNGAMANWITIFVEVPIITFNPVKTVLDLLRKEHQPLGKP